LGHVVENVSGADGGISRPGCPSSPRFDVSPVLWFACGERRHYSRCPQRRVDDFAPISLLVTFSLLILENNAAQI
jgi:hypothetical protein